MTVLRNSVSASVLLLTLAWTGCTQPPPSPGPTETPAAVVSTPVPSAPEVALTPGKVRPGIGFEEITLGQTREEVTKILGEPEQVDANEFAPGQTYACYYSRGIELTFSNDRLAVITLQSPSADSRYQTYTGATEQGLGVGTAATRIVEVLGEPAPDSPRALRYPKLGVWFRLDAEREATDRTSKAQSVQLMKPE